MNFATDNSVQNTIIANDLIYCKITEDGTQIFEWMTFLSERSMREKQIKYIIVLLYIELWNEVRCCFPRISSAVSVTRMDNKQFL